MVRNTKTGCEGGEEVVETEKGWKEKRRCNEIAFERLTILANLLERRGRYRDIWEGWKEWKRNKKNGEGTKNCLGKISDVGTKEDLEVEDEKRDIDIKKDVEEK